VWYAVNLLAAGFLPGRITPADLGSFHWDALIIGGAILMSGTVLIGLLYGAILPMFPHRPIIFACALMPLFISALASSLQCARHG
jgi:hypothetical protein